MIKKVPLELLFFASALVLLFFLNTNEAHASLCPLAMLDFKYCPGCGLGRSIHFLMHGEFQKSWDMHPLGFFAFFVIISRVYTLSINRYLILKK